MENKIQPAISTYQADVINHPVYKQIHNLDALRLFMEHHVYAVWDFMSLVKSLQLHLTCVQVPWVPVHQGNTRYLINEIITGEESDIDLNGIRKSHFEMYLEAMDEVGADTSSIKMLIHKINQGVDVFEAIDALHTIPAGAKAFMRHTFELIKKQKVHLLAAVFTYGREDLIPEMFKNIVADVQKNADARFDKFIYYLDRHIEVDGDHHSKLAIEMTEQLCGQDPTLWQEATEAVKGALQARKMLWDSAYQSIMQLERVSQCM